MIYCLKYNDNQLFSRCQILDSSKLKEVADDNSKFDENGRNFYKRVENTVEKGEIAQIVKQTECLHFQKLSSLNIPLQNNPMF